MTSPSPDAGLVGEEHGPLVLVVDDDARNRRLAVEVLRLAGLETVEAGTGAEALSHAFAKRPDLVLLDLQLPDLDGVAVARELRADARTAEIPVVALSALRLDGREAWLREAGFDGFLAKPIDVAEFPHVVRGYCSPGRRAGA
jgi:two-component system cell cycle response regulator DivK